MSKEREFLKKLRYATHLENDLRKELEELLAQPEQEPFIFKDRKLTGSLIVHDDMYKKGYAQAELDLKREPLNESKISAIWGDSDYDVSIVRAIEKEHGITGVEE